MSLADERVDREARSGGFPRFIDRLAALLALIGGFILTAVACMVTASVLGRWLLGTEIPGAFEIVQVGAALAGFLFLPICQLRQGNIVVDAFTTRAPRAFRMGLDAGWAAVYAAVAAVLAWRLAIGAAETIRSGTVTAMIRLPFGWAMAAGAAVLVVLSFAAAVTAARFLRDPSR